MSSALVPAHNSDVEQRTTTIVRHLFPNVARLATPSIASSSSSTTTSIPTTSSSNTTSNSTVETEEIIQADVAIVGAGITGCALAHCLAKKGFQIAIVERDLSEPDRIIGELLQPGGVQKLREMGLEQCLDGIDADPIHGYSIFMDGERLRLGYPHVRGKPTQGRAFHHGRFVMKMRAAAQSHTNVALMQGAVTRLVEEDGRITGMLFRESPSGRIKRIRAFVTIVCDGSGSVFRSKISDAEPIVRSHFVGILMEGCNETLPFPHHGHVMLAKPSPVLAYPISSKDVRVLVDIPGKLPSVASGEMERHLLTEVVPQLPPEIRAPFVDAVKKGRIRSIPNKVMSGKPYVVSGAILLGDAFNCRHPLTGGGMTVAFSDVHLLASLLKDRRDISDLRRLDAIMARFYSRRKPYAGTINILANALYSVFSARDDPSLPIMRKACFDYFKLGGIAVSGPVGLLSGLKPSPALLVFHFFSVALYGVARLLFPFPTPARIWMAFRLLRAATSIVRPLIMSEQVQCWKPSANTVCRR